ncbi:hypothetical protein [Variovorax sp. WS11]|nr:hypothetical protein [Variovorax sp. WS11]
MARATWAAASIVAAPGLFSGTMRWPRRALMVSASTRARLSLPPPGT